MPGSFSTQPPVVPLNRLSKLLAVFRRTDVGGGDIKYQLLPNVRVLSIEAPGQGASTGSARFRYSFGDPLRDAIDPQRFEAVYPLDAEGPRVVKNDDRLVVRAYDQETGESVIMFDGFVRTPQADLDAMSEVASFTALGTPIREWSQVLGGPSVRDADDPLAGKDIFCPALRTRFNPDGRPNCTPEGGDSGDTDESKHPKFLGPVWPANKINGETIRYWTLINAAKYLIVQGNFSQEYTSYGDLDAVTSQLFLVRPEKDGGSIDWNDASTYETGEIEVEDMDVTGAAWPEALERLIAPHGFAMRFLLADKPGATEDAPTDPDWTLQIYRLDKATTVKSLRLQQAGEAFDPVQTNVKQLSLARDTADVENLVILDSGPILTEASFLLAPGFEIASSDSVHLEDFEGEDAPATYREWIYDECGEGHWDFDADATVTDEPGDFTKVFTGEDEDEKRNFVRRRRPGIAKLNTEDGKGKPLRAVLHYSHDYAGPMPGVWDKTGTWVEVASSEWRLLDDRLGIRITAPKPNEWKAGEPKEGADDPYQNGGVVNLVDWCANPTATHPYPRLRLTCVVESDHDMGVQSDWRQAVSITDRPIVRHHDVRDRFRQKVVSQYSYLHDIHFEADPDASHYVENDEDEAQDYADALRRAKEAGSFAGSVTLHGIRLSYEVGDKIDGIDGRGVSFRQNLGESEDESPVYPTVVGVRWDLDGQQTTVLQLQDLRAEPPPKRRRVKED